MLRDIIAEHEHIPYKVCNEITNNKADDWSFNNYINSTPLSTTKNKHLN